MDGFAKSTIAALLYAQPGQIAFPDLVADLAAALLRKAGGELDIHTAYEDFVIFDLEDTRICLAHSALATDYPGAARASRCHEGVIISVGEKPDGGRGRDHRAMCECLMHRVETRSPADGAVVAESNVAFTEEAFDSVLDDILNAYWDDLTETEAEPVPAPGPDHMSERAVAASVLPEAVAEVLFAPAGIYAPEAATQPPFHALPAATLPRRAGRFGPSSPRDLAAGLAARFDREIAAQAAARSAPRPVAARHRSPGPTLFPTTTYGEPRPRPPRRGNRAFSAFGEVRRQPARAADHRVFPEPAVARAQPLVHRGAIHAVNVAMMAFSLPVGAFLLTLALLGRESLVMSSRATAITGAGIGISQGDPVGLVLSFLS